MPILRRVSLKSREAEPAGARSGRAPLWLALGAALGASLAAVHVLGPAAPSSGGAVALVNGVRIEAGDYRRGVEALAADKRAPLTPADRAHVLRRMIEEELLIQRGVSIGLVRSDRGVRAAIASAMIDSILADVAGERPAERELREFYAENRGYFAPPQRVRVETIFFAGPDAAERATAARAALRSGETFDDVRQRLGDRDLTALPDALLPATKLRDYLGPSVTEAALRLAPGAIGEPIATPDGHYLVRVSERQSAPERRFTALRPQIEVEFARRAGDRALRAYLEGLRDQAELWFAPDAPR